MPHAFMECQRWLLSTTHVYRGAFAIVLLCNYSCYGYTYHTWCEKTCCTGEDADS
jgi:hypothetical protein